MADTYFYSEPYDDLKHARIDTGEAVAFALASRLMAAWRGTPLGRALISIYAKIAPLVAGAFTFPISALDEVIYIPEETDAAEFQHIGTLVNACQRRQTLRISHQKPGDTAPTLRTVEPLGVAFFDYRWILVAVDPVRKKPCNFRLMRLHGVSFTGKSFTPPAGFNLAKHLEGNFGPYTGDEDHTVVVALTGFAASNAFERRWHKSRVLTQRPGGGGEITLRLNNLVDVQREILSWGAEAEPLAPPQLRADYRAAVAAMAARVADQPPAM